MMDPEDMHSELIDHANRIDALELAAKTVPGLDGMTLAQLEAMAARLGAAAKTIRDAQQLLGATPRSRALAAHDPTDPAYLEDAPPPRPVASPDAIAAHRARQFQPVEARRPRMTDADLEAMTPAERARAERGGSQLTPAEQAEKRRKQLAPLPEPVDDPNLPDEIRAMERGE